MKLKIIFFTKNGYELAEDLKEKLKDHETELCDRAGGKEEKTETLHEICRKAFSEKTALLFIGATGIAVRHIAPFVKDKLTDPPVLVMDEKAIHVIPLLSGHMGGANELAFEIAKETGADPVITTATDLNRAFSVDLFAKENGLEIKNREGIAKVSVKALEGKPVVISVKDYPPKDEVDVLITDDKNGARRGTIILEKKEKRYILGIGCRKGKSAEEIDAFVNSVLDKAGIGIQDIYAVGTIDIKADEQGLLGFAKSYDLPLIAFEAGILEKAEGDFTSSDFVKETTGVDNVCERAAITLAGAGGRLVIKKQAEDGVTVAVSETEKKSFPFF